MILPRYTLTACNYSYIQLIDFNARFYSPRLGRFIQPDTVIPNPANPQSLNHFSYAYNNPLNYIDPSGHIPEWECGFAYGGCGTVGYTPDEGNENTDSDKFANLEEEILGLRRGRLTTEEILLSIWQDPLGSDTLQGARFGEKRSNTRYGTVYHMSIDVGGVEGQAIYPGAGGIIVYVNNDEDRDLGVSVIIKHTIYGENFYSVYAHMVVDSVTHLSEGQAVDTGTQIGQMGQTGTDNVHLHFEVRKSQNLSLGQVNPLSNNNYWGFRSPEWRDDFVDLGQIYGYSSSFAGMP